jgi:5'-nucleotidase
LLVERSYKRKMKNKLRFIIYGILCLILVSQSFPVLCVEVGEDSIHLVILHINDTHGRLRPYDIGEHSIGGIARLATMINQIRKGNEDKTLVLHAGDVFSRGDSLTVNYGGEVNLLAMEAIGFDAFTPGNGEFYFSPENLLKQVSLIKFPVIHANVIYKENGRQLFQPYVIRKIAGIRIAILGLGIIRKLHPSAESLELLDPTAVARAYIPALRDQADLIIALTHIGLGADKNLAEDVPQIDVIVGGHSHNRVDKPIKIPRPNGKGEVIVVQAGEYYKFLGKLDLYLQKDSSGKYLIVKSSGELLSINKEIEEDEKINEILDSYSESLSEVICTSKIVLENPSKGDSPLGKLVATALRNSSNADLAMLDRGAVQSKIEPGELTVSKICNIHPWRNRVLEMELTGEQIREILSKNDIHTSGISYLKKEDKVENLNIGLSPVIPDKFYKVAVGEFLVGSTQSLRELPFKDTRQRVDAVLLKYLKDLAVIK